MKTIPRLVLTLFLALIIAPRVAAAESMAMVGAQEIGREYMDSARQVIQRSGGSHGNEVPLLRRLVEMKLLSQYASARYPVRAQEVLRAVEREEAHYLAGRYEALEIDAKATISDKEVESIYTPPFHYRIRQFVFKKADLANLFLKEYRDKVSEFPGWYGTAEYPSIALPTGAFAPAFAKALPSLRAGDWYGPEAFVSRFFVYHLLDIQPPDQAAVREAKEKIRREIGSTRLAARKEEVLRGLREKYGYHEESAVLGPLFLGETKLETLPPDTMLATISAAPVRVDEFRADIESRRQLMAHQFFLATSFKRAWATFVAGKLEERAAREMGLQAAGDFAPLMEFTRDLLWVRILSDELSRTLSQPSEGELAAYHRDHRADFKEDLPQARELVVGRLMADRLKQATDPILQAMLKDTPVVYHVSPDSP